MKTVACVLCAACACDAASSHPDANAQLAGDPLLGTWQKSDGDYVFLPSVYEFKEDGTAYLDDLGWGTWDRADASTIHVCAASGCKDYGGKLVNGALVLIRDPETLDYAESASPGCCPQTFTFRPFAVSAGPTAACPQACSGMDTRKLTRGAPSDFDAVTVETGDCACNLAGTTGSWTPAPAGFDIMGTTAPGSYVQIGNFISTDVYTLVQLP